MDIIRLSDANLEAAAKKAADTLKKGGILIYPTDTLYGLGVAADNEEAIERLKELKGREKKKPISVIVEDASHISKWAVLTPLAQTLADKHLPGALTLVVPAVRGVSPSLQLNGAIGIRVPADRFCLALARAYGKPFTTTSANKAGQGVPRTAEDLMQHFGQHLSQVALVIDDGPRTSPNPSTVVSCVGEVPYVLREGALSREELGIG